VGAGDAIKMDTNGLKGSLPFGPAPREMTKTHLEAPTILIVVAYCFTLVIPPNCMEIAFIRDLYREPDEARQPLVAKARNGATDVAVGAWQKSAVRTWLVI